MAVDRVSCRFEAGTLTAIVGPNGAGKTTCFYMIVGLVPADAGRIELDGRELTRLPIHRRARLGISYLPQENSVFRKLSVEENVRAVLELAGIMVFVKTVLCLASVVAGYMVAVDRAVAGANAADAPFGVTSRDLA